MPSMESKLKDLVVDLYKIGALKFGDFKMKVGINSPVYLDLRVLVSHPKVLEMLSLYLWEFAESKVEGDHLCGVPYNALPIATIIAVKHNIPMLIRRKEAKKYGTKKLIEGKFKEGDTCVIIEDVVTSGSSIMETVKDLENEGLKVTGVVVIVDRGQGGMKNITNQGITAYSMLTLTKIMHILCDEGYIGENVVNAMDDYLGKSQIALPKSDTHHSQVAILRTELSPLVMKEDQMSVNPKFSSKCQGFLSSILQIQFYLQYIIFNRLSLAFGERAAMAVNLVGKALLHLMEEKKSNLCVAVDVISSVELLQIAAEIGPYICLLKTHADTVNDFTEETAKSLQEIAKEKNFIIMEDRKFSDIGKTVSLQYGEGPFKIVNWADLVTCHSISGEGAITGLKAMVKDKPRGCFLVAEMSSEGSLISSTYSKGTIEMAETHSEFVAGLVTQSILKETTPGLIQLTPGVRICSGSSTDGLGQQWVSPEEAVINRGADVVVVGRGITEAQDKREAAKLYQSKLWSAYLSRIEK